MLKLFLSSLFVTSSLLTISESEKEVFEEATDCHAFACWVMGFADDTQGGLTLAESEEIYDWAYSSCQEQ